MTHEAPVRRRDARPPSRPGWRMPWATAALAAVALAGIVLLTYPTAAAWWSQYNQSQLIVKVGTEVRAAGEDTRARAIAQATAYNTALVGGALVDASSRIPTSSGATAPGFDYRSILRADADGVMARLRIPSIGVDLPIYHGTADATLSKGVGHLEGTSLPVGGSDQHSVLTAHRGLAQATLFDDLDRVRVGDTFSIEVFGRVLTYRVTDTRVVQPEETETLSPKQGEDLVTLVTCTPLGINTHRILVTGERVTPTPDQDVASAGRVPDVPGFPWWAVIIGGSLIVLTLLVRATGQHDARHARVCDTPGLHVD